MKVKDKVRICVKGIIISAIFEKFLYFVLQSVNTSEVNKSLSICTMFIVYFILVGISYLGLSIEEKIDGKDNV